MSRDIGFGYELIACEYLQKQGLVLLEKNFQSKMGEIDLIMKDKLKNSLVFVEVKFRQSEKYGLTEDMVTPTKQKRLIRTAKFYLQQKNLYDKIACRFDVIAIAGNAGPENPSQKIHWIPNAFETT